MNSQRSFSNRHVSRCLATPQLQGPATRRVFLIGNPLILMAALPRIRAALAALPRVR